MNREAAKLHRKIECASAVLSTGLGAKTIKTIVILFHCCQLSGVEGVACPATQIGGMTVGSAAKRRGAHMVFGSAAPQITPKETMDDPNDPPSG